MLSRLIHYLFEGRHYWRTVSFSELAELYTSRLLRAMAVNMTGVFVVVYLYQSGYRMVEILLILAAYFAIRGLLSFPMGHLVASIGPKHATLFSNLAYIGCLIVIAASDIRQPVILTAFFFLQALSVTSYAIAFDVDFSKIKHNSHVGKEIGYMHIIEKIGAGLAPLIGGIIAYLWGPQYTMWVGATMVFLSAYPLLMSPEPIRLHQHITFRGLAWKKIWRQVIAQMAVGYDIVSSGSLWSLYVALAIFGIGSSLIYAELGVLMSVTLLTSIVGSKLFGILIDRRKGKQLLQTAVIANSIIHFTRLFVTTPVGVGMLNIGNEMTTSGYNMPFAKGQYDTADSLPGFRVAYMSVMNLAAATGSCLAALVTACLAYVYGDVTGLAVGFIVAAIAVLFILANGFRVFKPVMNAIFTR